MQATTVKQISEIIQDGATLPAGWGGKVVINEDNLTYFVWNEGSREAIVIDPVLDDWETLVQVAREMRGYRFLFVMDTHTHADHVSCAAKLADHLRVSLVMHQQSPSQKPHLRICRDMEFPSAAATLRLLVTPGHTPDSITPIWGPFLFGSDVLLYGDTGRDDLPGGDPAAHWESLQKIKESATPDLIMLPGHDGKARASSWKTQLEINPALKQGKEVFMADGGAWVGPSPKLLKVSLYENFK